MCTGLFSYKVDFRTRSVYNLSLISFDKNNIAFIKDVYDKFLELMEIFDRIEWKCISGNPVERHYDRIVKKYGGQKLILHKCVIDNYGKIHDDIIYEIMTKENVKDT